MGEELLREVSRESCVELRTIDAITGGGLIANAQRTFISGTPIYL